MSLLVTMIHQVLAFIACNPAHLSHMHWSWDYLNPLVYLTGYGSWYQDARAIMLTIFDVMQLLSTYWGHKKYGSEWFKMYPGHWAWWIWGIYTSASH
ncbi:unnamed protein product [Aureobasidium vineae]|uniref:Uncharacterized protein n=1 Tax=Aureobasidium vineae TaxID=2773715 RepID=A0A9N8PC12_9PEZI|nr:unnamed protein product [Aureobasidium vineae]